MSRIVIGLCLLFVSLAAVAAEAPSRGAQMVMTKGALSGVERPATNDVLSALLAPGSCATRARVPADIPVLLARPLQTGTAKIHENLPDLCCACGGTVCCPQNGTCISCGFLCICCNP